MKRRALRCLPAAVALGVFALLRVSSPESVERVYADGVYPRVAAGTGAVSDLVPFSIAEIWAWLLLGAGLFLIVRLVLRLVRRRFSWRRAGRFWASAVLVAAPAVYLAFVGLWGANYGRLPVERKTGHAAERITTERLREALEATARAAGEVRPSGPLACDEATLARTVDAVDGVVAALEGRAVPCARRPKTLLANGLFRLLGIHGLTVPFTHEAHHRADLLAFEIPFVVAHERAHLAGYGSEAEANFVAYHACVRAEDPVARYAGRFGLLRHLLGSLPREERMAAFEGLPETVREDLRAVWRRDRDEESAVTAAARTVNDAYLRANRVEAGTADYGRVVRLVLGADPAVWGR